MTISTPAKPAAPVRGETKRVVRNGTIELAVFEQGNPDGETIVMVHGWPDTHRLWDGVLPGLADKYRLISYDARGYGESTNPAKVSDFRLAELAKDFFAVADAVSPDRPVHVLAHDWGSVQMWEAVCEPGAHERIASFTSISGPNLDHVGKWMRDRLSRPTPKNVWQPTSQLLSSLYTFFFMTPVVPRVFFRLFGNATTWSRFLGLLEGVDPAKTHFADTLTADMISGLRIYRANILQRIFNPRERYTSVPVLLLVNTRDISVRPAGYDDTARWVESVTRRDIPSGHWLPFKQADLIATATAEFIESVGTVHA